MLLAPIVKLTNAVRDSLQFQSAKTECPKPRNSVGLFLSQRASPTNVCTEHFIRDLNAYLAPAFDSLYRQVEDVVQELLAKSYISLQEAQIYH